MPTDKQRREAERRRQQRQLQRRRERALRRRRINLVVSVVGALAVAAVVAVFVVNSGSSPTKAAAKTSTPASSVATSVSPTASPSSSATVAKYPCTWTKSGTAARAVHVPSTTTPSRTGTVGVTLTTTRGPLTLTLNRAAAPCAVASFVSLAQQKYFDDTPCHRLVSSSSLHVLQCGDPKGLGTGGPGYMFADELTGKEKYTRGVLAMANGGANTNGSQFFIVYGTSTLQPAYTIFGSVTKGLGVVDAVAKKGSTPATDGKPKESISITRATVG